MHERLDGPAFETYINGTRLGGAIRSDRLLENGTIVRISYDMWVENVDGLFDTTDRDRASESGIYNPEHNYGPIVAAAGAGRLVPGLEKALLETDKVGEWIEIELEPEDAFGPRDPSKIETVPMQRFKSAKVKPQVGQRIQYKNQNATVTRVAGGRVWLDTNSPLAGRTAKYRFKVDEIIEEPLAKVGALLDMNYRPGVGFEIDTRGENGVEVVVPDQVKYDQQWALSKFRMAHDVGRFTQFGEIRFTEVYTSEHPMAGLQGAAPEAGAEDTAGDTGEGEAASETEAESQPEASTQS